MKRISLDGRNSNYKRDNIKGFIYGNFYAIFCRARVAAQTITSASLSLKRQSYLKVDPQNKTKLV